MEGEKQSNFNPFYLTVVFLPLYSLEIMALFFLILKYPFHILVSEFMLSHKMSWEMFLFMFSGRV